MGALLFGGGGLLLGPVLIFLNGGRSIGRGPSTGFYGILDFSNFLTVKSRIYAPSNIRPPNSSLNFL